MRKSWYIALSIFLLAPVYWQPRVQAGDLSSHIYNAWLAQLIETGRTQGLVIVSQTTNILFDLMLGGLFRLFGAELAQRISVSVAVLVLVGVLLFRGAPPGGPRASRSPSPCWCSFGGPSALSPSWAAGRRGTCCLALPCWPMAGSSTWAFSISTRSEER